MIQEHQYYSLGMWEAFQEEVTSQLRLKEAVRVNQMRREIIQTQEQGRLSR